MINCRSNVEVKFAGCAGKIDPWGVATLRPWHSGATLVYVGTWRAAKISVLSLSRFDRGSTRFTNRSKKRGPWQVNRREDQPNLQLILKASVSGSSATSLFNRKWRHASNHTACFFISIISTRTHARAFQNETIFLRLCLFFCCFFSFRSYCHSPRTTVSMTFPSTWLFCFHLTWQNPFNRLFSYLHAINHRWKKKQNKTKIEDENCFFRLKSRVSSMSNVMFDNNKCVLNSSISENSFFFFWSEVTKWKC